MTNVNPEKLKDSADKAEEGAKQVTADGERMEADAGMEVEGELVETMTVTRGGESTFHTRLEALSQELAPSLDVQQVRKQLEQQLASWSQVIHLHLFFAILCLVRDKIRYNISFGDKVIHKSKITYGFRIYLLLPVNVFS